MTTTANYDTSATPEQIVEQLAKLAGAEALAEFAGSDHGDLSYHRSLIETRLGASVGAAEWTEAMDLISERYAVTEEQDAPTVTTAWVVAPSDQGQMVEIAYAADWESGILYQRSTDRSDRSVTYRRADADDLIGEWAPQNVPPSIAGDWKL